MENSPDSPKDPKKSSSLKGYAYVAGVGMSLTTEMAVAGFLGWWLGTWADEKWGFTPWMSIIGILVFVGVSMVHIVQTLLKLQRMHDKDDSKREDRGA